MPYNNYPKAASENAQRALDHKEKNGSKCGTPVGWARANQLASRESISDETVVRTYSFLSRAGVYDQWRFTDEDGKEICGSIMYAAWGGNLDTVKVLLSLGADPDRKDKSGKTALDYAMREKHSDVVGLLTKHK